ncbi:MAG: hydroxymethylpyrimidine/phosphomethylpyrimidine kinase [Rickettsiales bacterium]
MKPPIAPPSPRGEATPYVLIIAGSDPSGGAGLQSDIKTALESGCESGAVATALTVQTGRGVRRVHSVSSRAVAEQLAALYEDVRPDAIKIGMIASAAVARAVAPWLEKWRNSGVPIVVDPICVSSSGHALLDEKGRAALTSRLFPLASVVTPNEGELLALMGKSDAQSAAEAFCVRYGAALVITGGEGEGARAVDYLITKGRCVSYAFPRVPNGENVRGTGCMFSCALASALAKGEGIDDAVFSAKRYVFRAVAGSRPCGEGRPVGGRLSLL